MTPEEEFIIRLSCRCLSAYDLLISGSAFLKPRSPGDIYGPCYFSTEDLYITDLKLFISRDRDFQFTKVSTKGIEIGLRP